MITEETIIRLFFCSEYKMKKLYFLLLFVLLAMVAHAQRIQVVDTDGMPLGAVCVTHEKGALGGNTHQPAWLHEGRSM